jgi:hypothetical protein
MTQRENPSDLDHDKDRTIYAFSSGSRELYTRDIYNSLALPPTFTIEFRYRKPWYNEEIESLLEDGDLENKEVIIVAASYTKYERDSAVASDVFNNDIKYGFYPLRRGKIIETRNPGDVLYLTIELSSQLVDYSSKSINDDSNDELKDPWNLSNSLSTHPRFGVEEDPNDVFLTTGEDFFEHSIDSDSSSQQDYWTSNRCEEKWNILINRLGHADPFEKTLFYRIESVSKIDCRNRLDPERLFDSKNTGYQLWSDSQYLLSISASFAGGTHENARHSSIEFDAGEKIQTLPPRFNLGFRTEKKEIILDPNTGIDSHNTSLTINSDAEFYTPEVSIPIRITPSSTRKYGPYLAFGIGVGIIVFSSHLASLLDFIGNQIGVVTNIEISKSATVIQLVGTALSIVGMQWYGALKDLTV